MPKLRLKSPSSPTMTPNVPATATAAPSYSPEFIIGDCRQVLQEPRFVQAFEFIFADPPFNIDQDYRGFVDFKTPEEYGEFTAEWIARCWNSLKPNGIMCLHGPDELVSGYLSCMACVPNAYRVAWVDWHYRFGQCSRSNWIDARCHCLIYTKPGPKLPKPQAKLYKTSYTWNPEAVLVESDRSSTYNDPRIHETERGGKRLPGTVWGVPSDGPNWGRVQGNNMERRQGHPNQLPILYLARLIRAYTNPGDSVLDPFCGSGTTAAVSQELGRICTTTDVSTESIASATERSNSPMIRALTRDRLSLRSKQCS